MEKAHYYQTIETSGQAEFKDRGSRFIAYTYPLKNTDDFKKILAAARTEGMEHYIVEQEAYEKAPIECVKEDAIYLNKLTFSSVVKVGDSPVVPETTNPSEPLSIK